jgi:cyclopropane fatty-acyl-phospholipid synthase-like methyltransferase
MKLFGSIFTRDDRVCPWWLIWTFDNPLRRYFQDPERIVGPFVRPGMTIADIGCGMGYFTIAMAKLSGESGTVLAVDLQQKMLDMMQRRAKRAGVADRIRPVRAAEDDISVKHPVHFVLAFWMVHEVKDIPRFFSQISSILNKDGSVLYVEPRMHVTHRRFQEILGYARQSGFRVSDAPPVRFSRSALLLKET